MNTTPSVERDERTVAVENAGHRWGYTFLACALLIDVAYRRIVRQEAAWDLLALVLVGGAVCVMYQACKKTLPHAWAMKTVLISVLGAVIVGILSFILGRLGWPGLGS